MSPRIPLGLLALAGGIFLGPGSAASSLLFTAALALMVALSVFLP